MSALGHSVVLLILCNKILKPKCPGVWLCVPFPIGYYIHSECKNIFDKKSLFGLDFASFAVRVGPPASSKKNGSVWLRSAISSLAVPTQCKGLARNTSAERKRDVKLVLRRQSEFFYWCIDVWRRPQRGAHWEFLHPHVIRFWCFFARRFLHSTLAAERFFYGSWVSERAVLLGKRLVVVECAPPDIIRVSVTLQYSPTLWRPAHIDIVCALRSSGFNPISLQSAECK
jgi:hypothetical protein